MISPYNSTAQITKDRIVGERTSYYPNVYYKSEERNMFYYINTKGYLHIVKPCKVNCNGEFSHYAIMDILLTKDNMLKDCGFIGGEFKTSDDVMDFIKENMEKR